MQRRSPYTVSQASRVLQVTGGCQLNTAFDETSLFKSVPDAVLTCDVQHTSVAQPIGYVQDMARTL